MKQKFIVGILCIAVLLGGVYLFVRPRLPVWTVEFMINSLEEDNFAMIFESDDMELTEEKEAILRRVLGTVSYEILNSRIEGQMAYVVADLTFMDIEALVMNNRVRIMENVLGNLGGVLGSFLSGGVEQVFMQELIVLLEDETIEIPLMTKPVEVPLERSGLLWMPMITEEWIASVFELNELEINLENLLR